MKRSAWFNLVFSILTIAICAVGLFVSFAERDWIGFWLLMATALMLSYVAACCANYLSEGR